MERISIESQIETAIKDIDEVGICVIGDFASGTLMEEIPVRNKKDLYKMLSKFTSEILTMRPSGGRFIYETRKFIINESEYKPKIYGIVGNNKVEIDNDEYGIEIYDKFIVSRKRINSPSISYYGLDHNSYAILNALDTYDGLIFYVINYSGDYATLILKNEEEKEINFRSVFIGEEWNNLKIEIGRNEITFKYDNFSKTYPYQDYSRVIDLVNEINQDTIFQKNYVVVSTNAAGYDTKDFLNRFVERNNDYTIYSLSGGRSSSSLEEKYDRLEYIFESILKRDYICICLNDIFFNDFVEKHYSGVARFNSKSKRVTFVPQYKGIYNEGTVSSSANSYEVIGTGTQWGKLHSPITFRTVIGNNLYTQWEAIDRIISDNMLILAKKNTQGYTNRAYEIKCSRKFEIENIPNIVSISIKVKENNIWREYDVEDVDEESIILKDRYGETVERKFILSCKKYFCGLFNEFLLKKFELGYPCIGIMSLTNHKNKATFLDEVKGYKKLGGFFDSYNNDVGFNLVIPVIGINYNNNEYFLSRTNIEMAAKIFLDTETSFDFLDENNLITGEWKSYLEEKNLNVLYLDQFGRIVDNLKTFSREYPINVIPYLKAVHDVIRFFSSEDAVFESREAARAIFAEKRNTILGSDRYNRWISNIVISEERTNKIDEMIFVLDIHVYGLIKSIRTSIKVIVEV